MRSARGDRIDALIGWALSRLTRSSSSPRLDAEVLLGFVLGQRRSSILGHPEGEVDAGDAARFRELIKRRAAGVPVAHLTGLREFYSLSLRVSPATLVPRPETELLVDKIVERLSADQSATVLDAGTGCGAVALAIKRHRPRCRMAAVDRSAQALKVAAANGARLGLHVHWIRSHWFSALAHARFDLIAANPPYVPEDDEALRAGDLRHEPRQALDGGPDGLESLREIVEAAPRVLAPGGTLALEHGCDQARSVRIFLERGGFCSIETFPDLAIHDRVTIGSLARRQISKGTTKPRDEWWDHWNFVNQNVLGRGCAIRLVHPRW